MKSSFDLLFVSDRDVAEIPMGFNSKEEEIIFLIREAGCKEHEKSQRKHAKELERTRKNDKLYDRVLCKIIAESILVGWKNVLDEDGEILDATYQNKFDALLKYKKLRAAVMDAATDESFFKDDEMDQEEGEVDTEKN